MKRLLRRCAPRNDRGWRSCAYRPSPSVIASLRRRRRRGNLYSCSFPLSQRVTRTSPAGKLTERSFRLPFAKVPIRSSYGMPHDEGIGRRV